MNRMPEGPRGRTGRSPVPSCFIQSTTLDRINTTIEQCEIVKVFIGSVSRIG